MDLLGKSRPRGWAAILQWQDNERELNGSEPNTTNNRMELMAAIMGLSALTRPMTVDLYTDSRYVMNGVQDWMPRGRLMDGRRQPKSQLLIKICGSSLMLLSPAILCTGIGSKAMLATH